MMNENMNSISNQCKVNEKNSAENLNKQNVSISSAENNNDEESFKNESENAESDYGSTSKWYLVAVDAEDGKSDSFADDTNQKKDKVAGFFSVKKPKDAGAGLASGLKSVSKGVLIGASSLVICPVAGAQREGVSGFFKGVGTGVVAAITLPLAGITVGAFQVARGVVNTPEAAVAQIQGKKWDRETRKWKSYCYILDEEIEKMRQLRKIQNEKKNVAGANKRKVERPNNVVVDSSYYKILDVPTNATQDEIRKQYYLLARKFHPDKNPDDPEAKMKFQKLGMAYQVLGDNERRLAYDIHGESATTDMEIIDTSIFFTMLFGSELLEPYIGKLKIALYMEFIEYLDNEGFKGDMLLSAQMQRVVFLAETLRNRLQAFVDAEDENIKREWRHNMTLEANKLCQSSFGVPLLEAVGWSYKNNALQFLGKLDSFLGLGGTYAKMKAQGRTIGNSWKTATSVVRAAIAARKLNQKEANKEKLKQKSNKKAQKDLEKNEDSKGSSTSMSSANLNDLYENGQGGVNDEKDKKEARLKTEAEAEKNEIKKEEKRKRKNCNKEKKPEKKQDEKEDNKQEKKQETGIPDMNFEKKNTMERSVPIILETMLNVCLIDVENTLKSVCKKVLKDMGVPITVRRLRAEGLIELGKIFQEATENHKKTNKEIKPDVVRQMEEAYIKTIQKTDEEKSKPHE